MNRIIKFRCWHKADKKYVPLTGISFETNEVVIYQGPNFHDQGGNRIAPMDDVILEQFIERLDKNGKEIHDGDIGIDEHGNTGEFYYRNGNWFFLSGCTSRDFLTIDTNKVEIIGNIHEKEDLGKE